MNFEALKRIDEEIDASRSAVVADTIRFVNIKSVKGESAQGAPFGVGPKEMLDEFYRTAEREGFVVADYGVGVVSAAMKDAPVDLGIWIHGDVVPEGDGWMYPPYDAREYKGCIIGRGAGDNKGQLAAAYNLFKIFEKLGITLKYNAAIYLGSDEETGKRDVVGIKGNNDAKGFINVATPPRISLVPDGGFPVGYGGFGSMMVAVRSKHKLAGFDFTAGQNENPGLAVARLCGSIYSAEAPEGCDVVDGGAALTAYTLPRHGTKPDPNGNMITILSSALMNMDTTSESDREILSTIHRLSLDIYGCWHPVSNKEDKFSRLIVYPKAVKTVDGYPELMLNIRYPYGFTFENIIDALSDYVSALDYEISYRSSSSRAYLLDKDSNTVKVLTDIYNDFTGEDKAPYILTGGTYAHELPNAYVFGSDCNRPPEDFPKGHGGVHGVDEAVSIDRLLRMMKIYARALLRLEEML